MNYHFGQKLKELRKEKGITQAELAQIFNTSKTTICQYETSKQEPDLTLITKIAIYFAVSTDYLLGLEDENGAKTYNTYNNYGTHKGDVKF
ncbi:MAG: helix-turn-helix transcriptional regulator [Clostridiales bacterium]|nr:helix-turn-helix transcriptional regulator [Clostridiales bacterium]